jgi:uncharacterized protein (TIGR02452 family)
MKTHKRKSYQKRKHKRKSYQKRKYKRKSYQKRKSYKKKYYLRGGGGLKQNLDSFGRRALDIKLFDDPPSGIEIDRDWVDDRIFRHSLRTQVLPSLFHGCFKFKSQREIIGVNLWDPEAWKFQYAIWERESSGAPNGAKACMMQVLYTTLSAILDLGYKIIREENKLESEEAFINSAMRRGFLSSESDVEAIINPPRSEMLDVRLFGGIPAEDGDSVLLSSINIFHSIKNTQIIKYGTGLGQRPQRAPPFPAVNSYNVIFEPVDCLYSAKSYVNNGKRPLVLNMANAFGRGGGWDHGARAQEEDLMRRSTYSAALCYPWQHVQYPLDDLEAVYTPDVTIFRNGRDKGYEFLPQDKLFQVSFIAVAGYRIREQQHLSAEKEEKMKDKIRNILIIAHRFNHDVVILSALGCGAFNNPPEQVAELFRQVIYDEKYGELVPDIVFAIIEDHNSRGRNFNPFKQIISENPIYVKPKISYSQKKSESKYDRLAMGAAGVAGVVGLGAAAADKYL